MSLTPGSNFRIGALTEVSVYTIAYNQIHFHLLRGDVLVTLATINNRFLLVLDTPPAELRIFKRGNYTVYVAADNATDAYVGAGELRFIDTSGKRIILRAHKHMHFASHSGT